MSIRRHTGYNLAGALLPLALSLVTVPLYIATIGEARYGVLAIAWLLLGYFGLFDLGLGAATAQRIAALEKGPAQERAEIFRTAIAINFGFGLLGGLLLWPVALYISRHLALDAALRAELVQSIPWLVIAVPVATLSGVLIGALHGRRQFLEMNVTSTLSSALAQIAPLLIALSLGPYLPWLIAAVLGARILAVIIMYWRCRVHLPAGQSIRTARADISGLLRFGGWVTVSSIIGPLMSVLDRLAIGWMIGPKAVTHYTVPFQIAERLVVLPAALSSALFPRMAASGAVEAAALVPGALRALSCIMTPLAVIAVLLIQPFLGWWITPAFAANAGPPAQLLVMAFWINALVYVPVSHLRATGRPDLIAKCHMGEFLPYIALLYLGLHIWGLVGAAVAFLIRVAFECILLTVLAGVGRRIGASLLRQFALLVGALGLGLVAEPGMPVWWLGSAGLALSSLVWAWAVAPEFVRVQVVRVLRPGI